MKRIHYLLEYMAQGKLILLDTLPRESTTKVWTPAPRLFRYLSRWLQSDYSSLYCRSHKCAKCAISVFMIDQNVNLGGVGAVIPLYCMLDLSTLNHHWIYKPSTVQHSMT